MGFTCILFHDIVHIDFTFQKLMTQDLSPVIDFYPVDFQTDLNGKQQDWEAVVLIPFIDEVSNMVWSFLYM